MPKYAIFLTYLNFNLTHRQQEYDVILLMNMAWCSPTACSIGSGALFGQRSRSQSPSSRSRRLNSALTGLYEVLKRLTGRRGLRISWAPPANGSEKRRFPSISLRSLTESTLM